MSRLYFRISSDLCFLAIMLIHQAQLICCTTTTTNLFLQYWKRPLYPAVSRAILGGLLELAQYYWARQIHNLYLCGWPCDFSRAFSTITHVFPRFRPALAARSRVYLLPLRCDWLFRSLRLVAIVSPLGDQALSCHKSHNVYAWNYIPFLGEIPFLSYFYCWHCLPYFSLTSSSSKRGRTLQCSWPNRKSGVPEDSVAR